MITIVGGVLICVASYMPWLTVMAPFVGTMSRSGLDGGGDGITTLILGLVAAGVGVAQLGAAPHWAIQYLPILLGAVGAIVGVIDLAEVNRKVTAMTLISAKMAVGYAGAGLYLLLVGAVITVAGGIASKRRYPTGR